MELGPAGKLYETLTVLYVLQAPVLGKFWFANAFTPLMEIRREALPAPAA